MLLLYRYCRYRDRSCRRRDETRAKPVLSPRRCPSRRSARAVPESRVPGVAPSRRPSSFHQKKKQRVTVASDAVATAFYRRVIDPPRPRGAAAINPRPAFLHRVPIIPARAPPSETRFRNARARRLVDVPGP